VTTQLEEFQKPPAEVEPLRSTRLGSVLRRLPDELGVIVALVVIVAVIGIPHSDFLQPYNLLRIMSSYAPYGMIACGMVYLLALGEIDLSVGWNWNFSAVMTAKAMIAGVNPWLAALLGVLFGAGLGLVNGLLTVLLGLPAIIITLGTYSMFWGLSLVVNKSQAVTVADSTTSFFNFAGSNFLTISGQKVIPVTAVIFLVLGVALQVAFQRTRFGYRVQAVGANPEAARLTGIPIALTKVQALTLLGAICGLAGALQIGYFASIDPQTGGDFIFTVIAAVIIGGTPLTGGSGTVIGALIGTLIIASIQSGIIFFGIQATWSTFVTGAVIIVAVTIDQIVRRQRLRRSVGGGV
jgi:ribose/xylose/arabinose/galactoside ABC-type transport system permease subunit